MSSVGQFRIRPAVGGDIPEVREMLKEYVHWIGLDLAFQEIDQELARLPGDYAPPLGALLVAEDGDRGRLIAMIGLRPFDDRICEMKRLFVRPEARGRGVAKQLIDSILAEARRLKYDEIRLDTLPMMGDAQRLYVVMGFADIAAYYDTPIAGTRFMALRLR